MCRSTTSLLQGASRNRSSTTTCSLTAGLSSRMSASLSARPSSTERTLRLRRGAPARPRTRPDQGGGRRARVPGRHLGRARADPRDGGGDPARGQRVLDPDERPNRRAHPRAIGTRPSVAGGGAGYHYVQFQVPCGWPAAPPIYVDLFSPERTASPARSPTHEEPNGDYDSTQFELYGPGATVGPGFATRRRAPGSPGPGPRISRERPASPRPGCGSRR